MEWNRSVFLLDPLDPDEEDSESGEEGEAQDNTPVRPRIDGTSPLKGEQATDNIDDEDGCAGDVKLVESLLPGNGSLGLARRRVEVEDDRYEGASADREVDIETPTPG